MSDAGRTPASDVPMSLTNGHAATGREQDYPLYAFCAEQLPDDWRERSSGEVAHLILTAAADPAAPSAPAREQTSPSGSSGTSDTPPPTPA